MLFQKNKTKKSKTAFSKKIKKFVLDSFDDNIIYDFHNTKTQRTTYFEGEVCYNFNGENGALKDSVGFEIPFFPIDEGSEITRSLNLPEGVEIKKIWFYPYYEKDASDRVDKIMFYTADNQLYSFILNSNSREVFPVLDEEYGITINSEPVGMSLRIFNGSFDEDYMLFSLENGLLVYSSRLLPVMVSNCPQFVSMVQIYDLLWAIKEGDRNVIIYNENLNPTQWNSSDFEIDLSQYGALIKLISFDDYLYVFREFGICKISMYSPQKFSVSNIYTSSAKIFADTIIICGDEIVFFAEDGLYSFNGSSVKRLTFGFEKLVKSNKQKPSATYFNDVYYLALKLDFDDEKTIGCEANENGFVNNALVCIDLHTKKYSITRGVDIYSLTPIFTSNYSTVLACFNGQYCNMIGAISQTGTNFSYGLNSYYKTKPTNFGLPFVKKKIKEIKIKTLHNICLNIYSEKNKKCINISGSPDYQIIKTNFRGEEFYLEIISLGKAEIYPIEFKVEYAD